MGFNSGFKGLKVNNLAVTEKRQERSCRYRRDIEALLSNRCCCGSEINIKYSECVFVAFVIQYAVQIRRIILSSTVLWLFHNFSHYLIKGTIFWEKKSYRA